ncbi:MAG TPA: hypothetical protein DCL73_03205 [Treponema sp.]|nr:hypothetical protein [Treponema sp.]
MTITGKRLFLTAAVCLLLPVVPLAAEIVTDTDFGWSLDLPEGFKVDDHTDDGMSYLFSHDRMPVSLAVKLYETGTYKSAEEALSGAVAKLPSGTCEKSPFTWRNTDCALGTFSMTIGQKKYTGWAESVTLPVKGAQLVLLCYADAQIEKDSEQFIMSVLNSLAIDRGSSFEPGIIVSYAFPPTEKQTVPLTINGRKIETQLDRDDIAAADFVVGCEYAVLSLYADNDKWQQAWQRYYRMIFRDSFGRLKKASFDINNALAGDAKKLNPHHPEEGMAQLLLTWTQGFAYEREKDNADFTPLPAVLTGEGSDCDSRSLLLCALLENMGTKTALFVSREYSHALFGADVESASDAENARMAAGSKNFLLGETTAHVNMGLIAQDMSDTSKWIPVELP